jgi:hypothetical protein
MGFFSWKTQDTGKSIANVYSSRSTFKVDMIDDKGNVWTENEYDGYGAFGGKDYYELLAEMNGFRLITSEDEYTNKARNFGIALAFGENAETILYPNLVEMARGWEFDPIGPENCESQGFFYDDEDESDEEDIW